MTQPTPTERRSSAPEAATSQAPDWVAALNAEQKTAVATTEGPVLVLAGAGTGKTRVLTTRLAYLLQSGKAWPGQILAVTFTNKAAREMQARIGALIGDVVEGMGWLGTFHAMGARILRRHAELVGLKSNFTIIDADDQVRLLKQLLDASPVDSKRWSAKLLAGLIDEWKNKALRPSELNHEQVYAFAEGKGAEFYRQYQERLKILNAADFGDLLLECISLFKAHPDILEDYQRRFKYILVDEYQDTNVAQYLWLRLLAQKHKNICCVGDDDQSIYGWRGAEVENILRFEKDFPGAAIIRLERNYRSTQHILGAASGLIAANKDRLGKTLWTNIDGGEKVTVRGVWDNREEARIICDDVEAYQRAKHSLEDIAILVRASHQMRSFEERLIDLAIPYRVIGGPRFFERAEIRDAIAYLRLINQPDDDLAFERILNKPKRGLGKAALQALHKTARGANISLLRAAQHLVETDELSRGKKSLNQFLLNWQRWTALAADMPHTELAETVLEESGYMDMWQNDKAADAPGRIENLKELIHSMEEFENLGGFLEHIQLVMENANPESGEKLSLMTLHGAKGLEFPIVFLPGWEEGLFPSQRTLDEKGTKGLEEERRLAYVGLTRAKKEAKISFVANRFLYNQHTSSIPSRFIDELPSDHIDMEADPGVYGNTGARNGSAGDVSSLDQEPAFANTYNSPGWRRMQNAFRRPPPLLEGQAQMSHTEDDSGGFTKGERIFHQKFGYGSVATIDGNKLTIDFEKAGTKKVMATFVERT